MRFVALSALAAACVTLAACDPAGPQAEYAPATGSASAAAIASANCDAELYQYLVGGPIEGAQTIAYAGTIRILGPDDFVTRDYDPSRLTVTTWPNQTIGRIFCG